jgi:hypothetical protein
VQLVAATWKSICRRCSRPADYVVRMCNEVGHHDRAFVPANPSWKPTLQQSVTGNVTSLRMTNCNRILSQRGRFRQRVEATRSSKTYSSIHIKHKRDVDFKYSVQNETMCDCKRAAPKSESGKIEMRVENPNLACRLFQYVSEFLTAIYMKNEVFGYVTPCSLVDGCG